MLLPRPKSARTQEQRPPVVAVLPHPDDRELLRLGLALSHAGRTCRSTRRLHRLGADLHPALRIARYGMTARSEADRAVRHLVESASRGAHVAVRPFDADDEARAQEIESVHALATSVLVVGRVRGRTGVQAGELDGLVSAHPGPIVVAVCRQGPPLREVLAVSAAPQDDPAHVALIECIEALETAYPTFRVRVENRARLGGAVDDAGEGTLLVAAVDARGLFGLLETKRPLWERHPGDTLLVFPPGDRVERLRAVLARLGDDESPPERAMREPPRWTRPEHDDEQARD